MTRFTPVQTRPAHGTLPVPWSDRHAVLVGVVFARSDGADGGVIVRLTPNRGKTMTSLHEYDETRRIVLRYDDAEQLLNEVRRVHTDGRPSQAGAREELRERSADPTRLGGVRSRRGRTETMVRINALTEERRRLLNASVYGLAATQRAERLREISEELDRLWLRRRTELMLMDAELPDWLEVGEPGP